ncbi:hypothetical protein D1BOALGB6SA_431 [Olavius sp. associated proteobacterium Delta 1]|nr:hypothetical protein D1BOALGB6SA_431 [Olavius sp. associated proteobacterium Delta 1]
MRNSGKNRLKRQEDTPLENASDQRIPFIIAEISGYQAKNSVLTGKDSSIRG